LSRPAAERDLEALVLVRFLRLNAMIYGIVAGVLAGLGIFVATNWLLLKGGAVVGPHLALLGQFLPGYRVTFTGSLIGLVYGFVLGFLTGSSIATMYNWLVRFKTKRVEDHRRFPPPS
jgi:hypothetical protein